MGLKQDLIEKRKELEAKQDRLKKVVDEAGEGWDLDKVTSLTGTRDEKLNEIRKMNKELDDLGEQVDGLVEAINAEKKIQGFDEPQQRQQFQNPQEEKPKSLGQMFVESDAYKNYKSGTKEGPVATFPVTLKTLMETSAGWAPESTRIGRLAEAAARPPQILEFIPRGTTGQAAIVYMQETTRTHGADTTSEGGTYNESTFVLAEQTSNVRKITDSLPVTDEQLDDVEGIRSYIDNRLRFGLEQQLDNQVINGSGGAPDLTGILNASGIQSQAKGTDTTPDAVYKALRKVRVTGRAAPNLIIIHPEDWEAIRLEKTDTGDYKWGHPAEPGPMRLWGVRIVEADVISQGTALTGDFATFIMLYERAGVDIQVGYSGTQFKEGKKTIRASIREALPIWRTPAFCQVTGL
jgi:HK97 family phage major capsid protein